MRKLNKMFHVDDEGYLVKSSNGERVPEEEPIFILRARDLLAVPTIQHYAGLLLGHDGDPMRMFELGKVVADFLKFKAAYSGRMKVPGSTQGR